MIQVGTSGWSYDDWKGPFYPEGLPRSRFLEFYADHFAVAEVNSSYYSLPTARMTDGLVSKTAEKVTFCVKAHRSMTHERDAGSTEYEGFRQAMAPLVGSGVLGAVLAQLPQSLKPDREGRDTLERLRQELADLPLAVEFRDRSWNDERVYEWLRVNDVGLCCVDAPPIRSLFPPVVRTTSGRIAYLRCHGRNVEQWYDHDEPWQRYDYRYSNAETREVASTVRTLDEQAGDVFVFYNNHYSAKAVDGARKLLASLA